MGALKSTPVIRDGSVWDPHQSTLIGDSYIKVDEACVLCILSVHVFQPFISRIIRGDYITIQYLQVSGNYFHHHSGQIQQVHSGSVSLTAAPMSVTEIRQLRPSASTIATRAICIHIARDHLVGSFGLRPDFWRDEYRDAFFNVGASSLSIATPLTPEMWIILDALIDCKFDEPIRSIYLKAKAVELLALTVVQFNNFDLPGGTAQLASAARDQRLIDIAALIYRRELNNPPSVEELSRRVGINRNKLTAGFQSAFGLTPADFSRRLRLEWAARRLSEGLDIRQAAAEVGYDSVPAFGRAFRQHHGRVPSELSPPPAD
ncbi:helix-turn-helix domain-containing protein [Labrys sp. KB_33_2]|uniref:helix-turn-helix domain-containing protein n=1 Tax=Labrys sp. KB_33_2 TaxID=3237479 RepID=UPI003F91701C